MKNYFKKSALFLSILFMWLSTSAYNNTYQSSHVGFVNKIKDSLVIVKYPNGGMPNISSDFIFVENDMISHPLSLAKNDIIGLFRFIDVGVPKPSAVNDYNKASFIRAFTNENWYYNAHFVSPEAYSFYKLANFNTDRKTLIVVEPNLNIRRGKPELSNGRGYSIIPIAKPSEVLKK